MQSAKSHKTLHMRNQWNFCTAAVSQISKTSLERTQKVALLWMCRALLRICERRFLLQICRACLRLCRVLCARHLFCFPNLKIYHSIVHRRWLVCGCVGLFGGFVKNCRALLQICRAYSRISKARLHGRRFPNFKNITHT